MKFRTDDDFASLGWMDLKDDCRNRSGDRCEFCGLLLHPPIQGHHRWYPEDRDTIMNVMVVHMRCHKAIHHGAKIKAIKGSLAQLGDSGKGDTRLWREYLKLK